MWLRNETRGGGFLRGKGVRLWGIAGVARITGEDKLGRVPKKEANNLLAVSEHNEDEALSRFVFYNNNNGWQIVQMGIPRGQRTTRGRKYAEGLYYSIN